MTARFSLKRYNMNRKHGAVWDLRCGGSMTSSNYTYQQIWAPLQCLTLVGMSNHCRNLGISNGAKLLAILQSKCFGGLGNWFLLPLLVENLEFGCLFCHFRRFTFHRCLSCAGTPRRFFCWFFATTAIPSPLPGPYVHEQVQGLLQVPGPLASTPHHPIDHACKFDPRAFCPQPHHPLRSIYNVTTSRNIYIPPPHTIQSVTSTMFASSMNFNIPPNTIHCVASTMIMVASSRIASSIDCEED